jgi:superfamily I DNA/RNA helicase
MIQELQAEGIPLCEIALLCRVASLFRPIEKELTSALIPYVLVDSLAFWERREVKDVMAYLRLIHNPLDYLSFKRIANVPPRKLGKKTFEQIERSLKASPELSLVEILESLRRETPALRWFLNEIDVLRNQQGKISGLIETVLGRMGYEAYLVKNFPDAERRIGNLMQLLAIAKRFDRESNDLSEFLLQASLSGNGSEGDGGSPEGVKLMTIHAAKGLEFRAVFVIGLEEGILPHARCRANLEEERRLLYVAVTRAKERLILTWCDRRMIHGKEIGNRLSSFVKDLLPRGPGRWLGRENPGIRVRYSPAARCDQSGLLKERTSHESVPQQGQ